MVEEKVKWQRFDLEFAIKTPVIVIVIQTIVNLIACNCVYIMFYYFMLWTLLTLKLILTKF